MNELERIALNEILRTVTYIAETLEEIKDKFPPNDSQNNHLQKGVRRWKR